MVKVGGKRGILLQFDKVDNSFVSVYYKTSIPAIFYDKDLKQNVKNSEGIEISLVTPLKQIVSLYLKAKTFENSFKDERDTVIFQEEDRRILFYKQLSKPFNLVVKGIDYGEKKAGISYIDTTNYAYVLLLSYVKTFLQQFPILSYDLTNDVEITYNREDKTVTVLDRSVDKIHYIEVDEINTIDQLLDNYFEQNMLFTHSLTPDHNIFIDKGETFHVNDKVFDFTVFKQFVYLTRIWKKLGICIPLYV